MVDHTKTETVIDNDLIKYKWYCKGMREAASICRGLANAEKEKADAECNTDGTGDYSGFHGLQKAEKDILAEINETPVND